MYNHASENYVCPFCMLVRGSRHKNLLSVPGDVIYQDERVTAFISYHQWRNNPGNVVIVPNEHYENIYDLPDYYAMDIHRAARSIALAMKAAFACDGISTRQHNEPAGNQDVWHYHLHVTPRFKNDHFYSSPKGPMAASARANLAEKLKDCLARQP
jgi:histidine triad (HIT) family protein